MSVFHLCRKISAAQTGPQQAGSIVVQPDSQTNPNTPTPIQQFQLDVDGSGSVSATAQILGSNDITNFQSGNPMHWVQLGQITSAGTAPASGSLTTQQPFQYFTAWISAISGTSAMAVVRLSA